MTQPPGSVYWQGLKPDGYFDGVFRDKFREIPIRIAVPGRGSPPHPGVMFHVEVSGRRIGSMPVLKAAQALAELHLMGRGRDNDRRALLEGAGLHQRSQDKGRKR